MSSDFSKRDVRERARVDVHPCKVYSGLRDPERERKRERWGKEDKSENLRHRESGRL